MATLIIGDFRGLQLRRYQLTSGNKSFNYIYLLEDTAEYSWLATTATSQLPLISQDVENVVLMLGFNDCAYSCIWNKTFNIDAIASDYVKTINELTEQYKSINFYACSVPSVDADYSFAEGANGVIATNDLNEKIQRFNSRLYGSKATFIDCYGYLRSTSLDTYDGVRYMPSTSKRILGYISSIATGKHGSAFVPRLTAPIVHSSDSDDAVEVCEGDTAWISTEHGGLNPDSPSGSEHAKSAGDTLPSCTAYVWGRFYELLSSDPTFLITNKVEQWYDYTEDGYNRGQTPALGAIMCWKGDTSANTDGNGGHGHVAIVEKINADGSIVTSESAWNDSRYWWTTDRSKGDNGNWGQSTAYTFQGFIYCPITVSATKDNLCTKNSYGISLDEMKPNAQYIWQYFSTRGWTINAVAGLLGNLQQESKMSPAMWESTIAGSIVNSDGTQTIDEAETQAFYDRMKEKYESGASKSKPHYPGYGLVQWTPYYKYTDWCNLNNLNYWDMDSQLQRITWEVENKEQWKAKPSKGYDLSFEDFIVSTEDAAYLAAAFAFCYERPGRSTGSTAEQNALREERGGYGEYWYNFLNSLPPTSVQDTRLSLTDFNVDERSSTYCTLSFVASNAVKATYELEGISREVNIANNFGVFDVTGLIPDKDYDITLTAESKNENKIQKKFSFTTAQDKPESFRMVELYMKDNKVPQNNFWLNIAPKKPDFGYWKKNSNFGYVVQLVVNGRVNCEKIVKSLQTEISLSDYFGYKAKLGDNIQIGLRTWVKNNDGDPIYDSEFAKVSNPICMLTQPVIAYLNIN